MKRLVLVDGNNLMFRSYYATAYSGPILRNSKGFPTNALYGFVSMMNKIIQEEKPEYIAVAFDMPKNFRKEEYEFYKEGRNATPDELKQQMPVARQILTAMGIKYLELEPYEADDIIGTLVKKAADDSEFDAIIISSDKDLLQLINFETDIKLLKKEGFVRYNEKSFKEEWGIDPIRIIDLKGLMGDPSDNIPGVKGIGEKTALKLLQEYGSLEGVYENIDKIKGATHNKLVEGKDDAFMSKKIATIYQEVPLVEGFEDLKYLGNQDTLNDLFMDLEFSSFLKKMDAPLASKYIKCNVSDLNLDNDVSVYVYLDSENYHYANVVKVALTDSKGTYILDSFDGLEDVLKNKNVIVYDYKKVLSKFNVESKVDFSLILYLLNYRKLDDIADVMSLDNIYAVSDEELRKGKNDIEATIALKSKYLFDNYKMQLNKLSGTDLEKLYYDIELPLVNVLLDIENNGMRCDSNILDEMATIVSSKIDEVSKDIYTLVGEEFNIASPAQLGVILFEKLGLPGGKKNKIGYKTDSATLEKLVGKHPVIECVMEYRNLSKLYSTYLLGLKDYIGPDGVIHPIFKQTLTRTGRLSCTEPNLQNIPTRDEFGKLIRKAFLPQNGCFLSCDYSQIELRLLAHIANAKELIDAFNNDEDIHVHVAADIYGIKESEVTKTQRKTAKAVIFGIVYGISGFGLGENLNISNYEAREFINKYYELYPNVKKYMDEIIAKTKELGYVTTLFGRVRNIEEINEKNYMVRQMGERMALNTPIQGTSADIIKLAMVNIYKKLKENNLKSKMVLQIHDELIFDCYDDELEKVRSLVKSEMENVVKLNVKLKANDNVATDWYGV